ncbi:hypothetical protein AB0C59_34190 [Streptomyces sp. NPDC048664]|uniref:hypothetical protein n=1 Tax=Streptomyces sp. NPDC048664 TaxID=3154505 RepID=UPI0034410EEB
MKHPRFRRCGHAPGAFTSKDQAAVDAFGAELAACKNRQPWTPRCDQDVAVFAATDLTLTR